MLKIGLIGCGFMGTMHANCYNALEGVCVTAVADVRPEKAETLAKLSGAKVYADGMRLIAEADVDAIDICLPTYLHASHAEAAMRKVKNVFIEKPVTLTAEESERLLEVQKETGAGVQVGQVIRFWDEYVWLKGLIDSEKYGKVKNAMFRRLSPRPDWAWEGWVLDAKRSGGALQDLHVHDADFMLYAFGEPKKFETVRAHGGDENSYVMTVCDYGDFAVSLEGSWDFPSDYPFEMYFRVKFERAVAEYSHEGLKLYADGTCCEVTLEKKQLSVSGGGNISDLGGYYNELEYFTDCLKAGKTPERAGLADATASVRFIREEMKR